MSDPAPNPPAAPATDPAARQVPSVLVITKNEEVNIAACLESLRFSDDVVVLDSHSTDRTVEIAKAFPNVRVLFRHFDTEWKHRNYGLHEIPHKHPWLYTCDADERVTPQLRDEILDTINDPSNAHVAFRVRYENMFLGRWIKRSSGYPVWLVRLVRPDKVRYEIRETNVHPIVDGTIGDLQSHFIHYSFNKGLQPWFSKHNFYSTMEASAAVRVRSGSLWNRIKGSFDRDPGVRRRAVKEISFFLPFRGLVRFLFTYFLRGGILDGLAGFHYSMIISMYEYWIEVKIAEQTRSWRDRTEAEVVKLLAEPDGPRGVGNAGRGKEHPIDGTGHPPQKAAAPGGGS